MKGVGIILLLVALVADPLLIRKINKAKELAESAYKKGDYEVAIQQYRYLIDSLHVNEDEVYLNMAHAYYLKKDTAQAKSSYQNLTEAGNTAVRSKALQQLGVMANREGKSQEALDLFKQAIKADSRNIDARYNYEMLKKKLENKNQENQKDKDDQKNQDKQEPSDFAKRLKEQADRLVAQHRYKEAHTLMTDGLKQDPTVAHYQDYIDRIGEVVDILK